MIEEQGAELIHVLISLAILLFAAKLFAELFHKFRIPVVLGVRIVLSDLRFLLLM
jgi:Kef-type K+ transport system membrane component KefB